MAEVTFSDVAKVFPDGTRAVTDLTLDAQDGEFMVLVGPSGCGKTTALRMVAGLEEISEGEIRIGDRVVNEIAPRDRDIAMVFQSYALYPHLTVYDNIAFSLRLRKEKKAEIDKRVKEAARILDLEALLERKPRALSGGQRQRVAMGRAIVRQPAAASGRPGMCAQTRSSSSPTNSASASSGVVGRSSTVRPRRTVSREAVRAK